jgi:hypothetical protein
MRHFITQKSANTSGQQTIPDANPTERNIMSTPACPSTVSLTSPPVELKSLADLENLPTHWLCDSLPKKSAEEINALAMNIRNSGQERPILIANGRIIDGRHRIAAFKLLQNHGQSIKVQDFGNISEKDIHEKVIATEMHIRSWTTKKKAAWAAKYRSELKKSNAQMPTVESMAEQFGISKRSLEYAIQALKSGNHQVPKPDKKVAKPKLFTVKFPEKLTGLAKSLNDQISESIPNNPATDQTAS